MALTINVLGGSKATNTLSVSVTGAIGPVTMSVVSGKVVFSDSLTTNLSTGAAVSNFATGGIPVAYNGASVIRVSPATFATAGLVAKLGAGQVGYIDATTATASQVAYMAANAGAIANNAIQNISLASFTQFDSLADAIAAGEVVKLNLAGATIPQLSALANSGAALAKLAAGSATEGIYNAKLVATEFDSDAAFTNFLAKTKVGGVLQFNLDGAGTVAVDNVAAAATKLAAKSVTNATVNEGQFVALATALANGGAVDVNATGADSTQVASIVTNKAKIAAGALHGIDVTAAQFTALKTQLATGGALTVDASAATSSNIASLVSSVTKLADGAVINAQSVTAAQFATLADKFAAIAGTSTGVLNVNAAGASAAQIAAITDNVGVIHAGSAWNGIYNLSLTGTQLDTLGAGIAAVKVGGILKVNASDLGAAGFNALTFNNCVSD